jgi:hypothetical protein
MTDLKFDDLPNPDQILVLGTDESGKRALIYIPNNSTKTEMFRTNTYYDHEGYGILVEEYNDLHSIQIIDIHDEDGYNFGLYVIIGVLNDNYETHVFFGFFTQSDDNKYFINDDDDFYSFSICNIQEPECLKFLGNFTWAICLKSEIRFIQIKQELLDAFSDCESRRSIIRSGVIFHTYNINFRFITPFNRGFHYSTVDTSPYLIFNYGDKITIIKNNIKKINYSDLFNTGTLRIEIYFNEKELPSNFKCLFSEGEDEDKTSESDFVEFIRCSMEYNE